MKKETIFNVAKISKEQSKELTTIVNETIATGLVVTKSFTAADLWNIQRRSKFKMSNRKFAAHY